MEEAIQFINAVIALRPNSVGKFTTCGQEITEWNDPQATQPTQEEINAQLAQMDAQKPLDNCKAQASSLLYATDWTTIPDVANPENNPYLTNQAEFIAWRSQIRQLAVNPVADPVFPTQPTPIWS